MRGILVAGVGTFAVAAFCLAPSLGEGASAKRGGNHGCNPIDGFIYSDHFHEAGDNVSFGFQVEEGGSFPRRGADHALRSSNTSSAGGVPHSTSCSAAPGIYTSVHSDLGPGNDSARLDAKGVPPDEDGSFGPIPKSIDSLLKGGGGDDRLRGHKGFDKLLGGPGADIIKADDGKRDVVKCGGGDSKDDVSGCEKKT
jgi:hypothetical protein